jgi:hypothetical protein
MNTKTHTMHHLPAGKEGWSKEDLTAVKHPYGGFKAGDLTLATIDGNDDFHEAQTLVICSDEKPKSGDLVYGDGRDVDLGEDLFIYEDTKCLIPIKKVIFATGYLALPSIPADLIQAYAASNGNMKTVELVMEVNNFRGRQSDAVDSPNTLRPVVENNCCVWEGEKKEYSKINFEQEVKKAYPNAVLSRDTHNQECWICNRSGVGAIIISGHNELSRYTGPYYLDEKAWQGAYNVLKLNNAPIRTGKEQIVPKGFR